MFWLGCLVLTLLFRRPPKTDIYINCEPLWYNGLTPGEFTEQQHAKRLLELYELYPELRYEILRQRYESGELTKEEYESALNNLVENIELGEI